MSIWVRRNNDGIISGLYPRLKPGIAEEELSEDHPDVLAFKVPPTNQERLNAELAAPGSIVRALALLVLDEFNAHAEKVNALGAAIVTGGTLAEIKSNITALGALPTRTPEQLKAALEAKMAQELEP